MMYMRLRPMRSDRCPATGPRETEAVLADQPVSRKSREAPSTVVP